MFDLITRRRANLKNDVLAGLTAVLTLIPEAVAFTFVAGIDPMMGLYGSFFIGFITAVFGGRPGMISGAAGSMAVVTTAFIIMFGLEYLLAAVVLTGILQVLFGAFKMGKFIRLLPHPVMLGFVNGLAIVIGMAQFRQFKENTHVIYDQTHDMFTYAGDWMQLTSPAMLTMMGLIALTMSIVYFLPRFTKAIPAPLAAIVVCTLLVTFTPLDSKLVSQVVLDQRVSMVEKEIINERFDAIKDQIPYGDYAQQAQATAADRPTLAEIKAKWAADQERMVANGEKEKVEPLDGSLKGTLPSLHFPEISWDLTNSKALDALVTVFLLALILSSVGLIETLMTLSLIDEITQTRGQGNRESIAQGSGNILSGLFGGMCGCAMIGQSMVCLNSGGRGRASGVATAIFMLMFILFFPGLIEMIPVASLIGVMFMVVIATFEWSSLRLFGRVPKSEIFIIVVVSAVTVLLDLAVAVGIGMVISALVYAWNSAKEIRVTSEEEADAKIYHLKGNLFFGSITSFKEGFAPHQDPVKTYIDFSHARICDQSGIEAVHALGERYKALNKTLYLRHLSPESAKLLQKAGDLVEVNIVEGQYAPVAHSA
ncbi:SulP family inorganic anion transporter [Marinomonas pollencensis]|uniref:SulP family sulfate permease n=1 Tax=Marinomonas pollencensis TaxID=491954 RepID=A0A3E0DVH9_9GAMM|nr:SulP family inorganic anion transporter [Marinomonas pollencensis]REG85649.1 SulP family sulfate permease [Marinomonas pollencensis]